VSLGAQPVSVGLRAVQTQEQAPAGPGRVSPLSTRLSILPENRRLYLIAKDLMAAAPPEAIYRLYLDLPAGAPDDPINSCQRPAESPQFGACNFPHFGGGGDQPVE
jgi:hypothetical protein